MTKGVDLEGEYICPNHINAIYPDITVERAQELIEAATEKVKDSSIDRLIDQNLKSNKPEQLSYAKQMRNLTKKYDENVERYRYGKKVAGELKSMIQSIIKKNPDIFVETDFIKNEELIKVFE